MSVFRALALLVLGAAASVPAQTTVPGVAQVIAPQTLAPGQAVSLNLATYFAIPGVTGQTVLFDTTFGKFVVELRADAAPQHVANFLGYVERGDYTNSFFHRSAVLDASGAIGIVQGGGYAVTPQGVAEIPAQAPVPLEYNLPNERGTLAAARTPDVNSATSQWYVNVRDNSTILGPENGGGYTVFGRVLGTGMTVVDAIAALPRVNASGGDPASAFKEVPVRNYTAGDVQPSNLVIVNSITPISVYPSGSTAGVLTFSAQSSAPGVVTPGINGSVLTLTPGNTGTASVTVTATDLNGSSISTTFDVLVSTVMPEFTGQPSSQTVVTGGSAVFTAGVRYGSTYQWQLNGSNVPGATNAMLVLNNASSSSAGTYTLIARNGNGSVTSNAATLAVTNAAPGDAGRLVNLSIRSRAGSGDQTLIVGFSLGGSGTSGSAPLLLRAVGPSLTQYGVTDVLADPVAALYRGSSVTATNDNWSGDATVQAWANQVQAFPLLSTSSLDAALAVSPDAGEYTMQVTGNGASTGGAIAEIYDATPQASVTATTPRLINVSARAQVGTGANILFAGFSITGSTSKTVLIRATGPALTTLFNLGGTLADPKLQLFPLGSTTLLAENDNWGGDPQVAAAASSVSAFPLPSGASKDAAILVTLPPGSYTAQVTGADGGTGVALVEVYEIP
jgi:cyclophilin family peptidyl-prolyl cis-trans isomerase